MKKLLLISGGIILLVSSAFFVWRQTTGLNDGMEYPRSEIHAATMGGNIYIAGGIGLFRTLDSCEYYVVTKKQWRRCANIPRPLHHVAMAADENRVYASGGYIALPFKQDTDAALFAYAPAKDEWSELAKLPHPVGQHVMVHRAGFLYLVGGQNGARDLGTLWVYSIAERTWSKLSAMPTPRHSHAIAISGGKLYVSGGRSAALGPDISVIEVYDFKRDSWHTLPNMPTGRAGHGSFITANKLHIVGGESLSEGRLVLEHEILDLSSLQWSTGKPLEKPRHGFAVGQGASFDQVYIIGGGAYPGIGTIYSVTGTTQTVRQ